MSTQIVVPVADKQSAILIGMIIGGLAFISIVVSWGMTRFLKQWRKDHKINLMSPSSSFLRAAIISALTFSGLWYVIFSLSLITVYDWKTSMILSVIVGLLSPIMWNPIIAIIKKRWPHVAEVIDK